MACAARASVCAALALASAACTSACAALSFSWAACALALATLSTSRAAFLDSAAAALAAARSAALSWPKAWPLWQAILRTLMLRLPPRGTCTVARVAHHKRKSYAML